MLPGWEQYDPHDLPQHLCPGLDLYSADAAEPVTTAASDELDDLGDDLICLSEVWNCCTLFRFHVVDKHDRMSRF